MKNTNWDFVLGVGSIALVVGMAWAMVLGFAGFPFVIGYIAGRRDGRSDDE